MKERGVNLESQTIAISHGDDEDSAKEIKTMIETEFHPKEVYINTVGCSVGAHSGPGTIAIFFSNKPIS
jgi:fatty acid-binding protein DegV